MELGEIEIENMLRIGLGSFPLYEKQHWIQVVVKDESIYISYGLSDNRIGNLCGTRFDLEILGEQCNINSYNIQEGKRRRGYGRELYNLLEMFCKKKFNCRKFVTSASGQGFYFWPKMGFYFKEGIEVEKVV